MASLAVWNLGDGKCRAVDRPELDRHTSRNDLDGLNAAHGGLEDRPAVYENDHFIVLGIALDRYVIRYTVMSNRLSCEVDNDLASDR